MQAQELADAAEDAAIARLLAMREIFMPCWGSLGTLVPWPGDIGAAPPAPGTGTASASLRPNSAQPGSYDESDR